MKKLNYILVFSLFTLGVLAQGKKSTTTSGNTKPPTNTTEKENLSDKELTNYLLTKFSASDRVEFDDVFTASKSNPESVTSLKLNKKGLTEIPDLSKFNNLVELDLSDNEISDFSSKLTGLNNLQVLNLSGNNLTSIPTDICNLKSLKTLNLSSNKISSGSLSCLGSLERLYLNNNDLTSIPAGITELQSLKTLYLHLNKLTTLDEKLARMPNLDILFVQFNKIADEPDAFENNGIINYVFSPQIINNKYLYKYLAGSAVSYREFDDNDNAVTSDNSSNLGILNVNERTENSTYNIKSVDAGNGYRKIKVNEHDYKRYSKFRMQVLFPLGLIVPLPVLSIGGSYWVLSKKHRSNYRLSKIHYLQQMVDKVVSKNPNAFRRQKVKSINAQIVRVYKRYLKSNGLVAN